MGGGGGRSSGAMKRKETASTLQHSISMVVSRAILWYSYPGMFGVSEYAKYVPTECRNGVKLSRWLGQGFHGADTRRI